MPCRPSKRSDAAPTELVPIFSCRSYKDFAPTELMVGNVWRSSFGVCLSAFKVRGRYDGAHISPICPISPIRSGTLCVSLA